MLVLLLGLAAGWFFAPPKQQKEIQDIAQQATSDFPGAMQRFKKILPSPAGLGAFFGNIPLHLGRAYDEYIPVNFRDTLAQGLPAVFAYPFICKIERVYRAADGSSSPTLSVQARMNGINSELRAEGVIRPGMALLATRADLGVDVACRNLRISLQPGTQARFLRGDGPQKVLEVRGGAVLQSQGKTLAGFSFPWGEVGLAFGEQPGRVQYRVNGSRPSVEVGSGQVEISWEARQSSDSPQELMHIFATPSAAVRIRHEVGGAVTMRELGPKRQASLLANGQISGAVGAFRGGGPPTGGSLGGGSSFGGGGGGGGGGIAEPPPGLSVTNPNIQMRTEGATVDVMLEWRFFPGNRVVACDIDMAADAEMRRVLAKYKSADMRLILQGMRPGIYFWRVGCNVDGVTAMSTVGKILVQDGRRSAAVPILQNPPNRAKIQGESVTYTWEKVDGAFYYVLQLSRDPSFKKLNEYLAKQGPGLKMNLKAKGIYYWRVYGIIGDSKEKRTGYSAAWSFTF